MGVMGGGGERDVLKFRGGGGGKFGEFIRIRLVGRGWGLSGMY